MPQIATHSPPSEVVMDDAGESDPVSAGPSAPSPQFASSSSAAAAGALWPVAAHGFRRRQTLWVAVNLSAIVVLLVLDLFMPGSRPIARGNLVRAMLAAGVATQLG